MSGSVFFVVILVVVAVAAVGFGVPFLLIPLVIIALGALAAGPVIAALRDSAVWPRKSGPGTPSTHDASYDPTSDPR